MEKIVLTTARIRALAEQPFHRPGGENFDVKYALAVLDARELVWLEELANVNPGKAVHTATMGFVPFSPDAASQA